MFSKVDDNESPIDILDPASPLSLNDSCIPVPTTDVSYGVVLLQLSPHQIKMLMSDCPEDSSTSSVFCKVSQFYTSLGSTSRSEDHSFPYVTSAPHVMSYLPLTVSSVSNAECCDTMSHHHHEIPSPTVDRKLLLSSPLLSPALMFVRLWSYLIA